MSGRTRCLLVAFFVSLALPVYAQGNGNGNGQGGTAGQLQALTARVTALEGAVNKLNGAITAADLVGTYTLAGIQTRLGGPPGPRIGSAALTGSLTLNADGTGTLTVNGDGSLLTAPDTAPLWALTQSSLGNGNPGTPFDLTWTYANGMLNLTIGEFGPGPGLNVGPGGRLLVATAPEFNVSTSQANVSLLIFYRLQ